MSRGIEDEHQEAIFQWCAVRQGMYPELKLLYHVPNEGKRDKLYAMALKRRGVKAGVPDMCLPVARCGYHGLYIELKVGKNKTTNNQKDWIERLNEQGYLAVVCYGWEAAVDTLDKYLKGVM